MARLGLGRRLVYALVATLGVLAAAETVFRVAEVWRPPLPVDPALGFGADSRLFVPDPDDGEFRITNPDKLAFFREARFRARKPKGVLRIAAVGGSSVNFLLPELEEMGKTLHARFAAQVAGVEIIDAGGMSYGSHRLLLIVAELLEYDPDVLLLYTGHNEFEEVEQLTLVSRGAPRLQAWLARSALVRALRDALTAVRVSQLERDHNRRILSDFPPKARAWSHAFTPAEIGDRMRAFRANLTGMIERARRRRVPVVLGTVPSNLMRPVLSKSAYRDFKPVIGLYNDGRHAEGLTRARQVLREMQGRHQASDVENEIIRSLAREQGVPLADVERAVEAAEPHGVPGETLFSDHCHLNEPGRALWLATFLPLVRQVVEARLGPSVASLR